MDELISRDALKDALAKRVPFAVVTSDDAAFAYGLDAAYVAVQEAPTIDPVRHGRWEAVNEHCNHAAVFRCSGRDGCGASVDYGHYTRFCDYDWCPNCGARMDAEEENDG